MFYSRRRDCNGGEYVVQEGANMAPAIYDVTCLTPDLRTACLVASPETRLAVLIATFRLSTHVSFASRSIRSVEED
jgi:hypothetical protein